MYLSVYPGGYGQGEGTHLSVFINLSKGPYDDELQQAGYWPLRGTFTLSLPNVYNSTQNGAHGYLLSLHYLLCEECTCRVIDSNDTAGLGIMEFVSNIRGSLLFRILYDNRSRESIAAEQLGKLLNLMLEFFIANLIVFSLIFLFPFLADIFLKFDIVYCIQAVYQLSDMMKNTTKVIIIIHLLIVAYAILILLIDLASIKDNVSAPIHLLILRLFLIAIPSYYANIAITFANLAIFLAQFLENCFVCKSVNCQHIILAM